jgi:hypothetical protein
LFACIVVVFLILMLIIPVTIKFAKAQPAVIDSSIDRAYIGIQEAANLGANVSSLTDKFNIGLDFLHQAQDSTFRTCLSTDNCKAMADETFASITQDSSILQQHYNEASNYHNIVTYGLFVPIIAFAASFCIICFLKVWRIYQIKKFLDMEIREKKD